jgi:pimeloyl-ACP methyl ester carboxylesterase
VTVAPLYARRARSEDEDAPLRRESQRRDPVRGDASALSLVVMPVTQVDLPDRRRIDVWVEGPADGIPLVFHHGTPGAGLPFAPMVRAIADRGLRYVSTSRAGYGDSSRLRDRTVADVVKDTQAVLDHLAADKAYVMGWSGGGPHALACAALMSDRVLGTTALAAVAPWDAEGLDFLDGMGQENIDEFGACVAGPEAHQASLDALWPVFRDVSADQIAIAFGDLVDEVDRGALTGEFAAFVAASIHEGLRESHAGWYDDDVAFIRPWGFDLAAIDRPVHIWQGAHDRMVPFAHGQWLAAHIPTACVHLYQEHGHLSLAIDSFPRILDEMLSFEASTPRA